MVPKEPNNNKENQENQNTKRTLRSGSIRKETKDIKHEDESDNESVISLGSDDEDSDVESEEDFLEETDSSQRLDNRLPLKSLLNRNFSQQKCQVWSLMLSASFEIPEH